MLSNLTIKNKNTIYSMTKFDREYEKKIETAIHTQLSKESNSKDLLKVIEGGKRLRAKLAFIVFKVCGGTDDSKGYKIATTAELMHNTSLLKDDIIDKDKERRGKESTWVEKGPFDAMRTADTMLISAIDNLVDLGATQIKTLLGGYKTAWEGEKTDFSILKGIEKIKGPFYTTYIKMIEQKTASLFSTFTKMSAQSCNVDESVISIMEEYGKNVGVAYQLADDMVDMKGGKIEFLPMIILAQLDQSVKSQIDGTLNKGRMNIGEVLLGAGINIEEFYRSEITSRINKCRAVTSYGFIPDSKFKILLDEFPKYCIGAMLEEGDIKGIV